MAKLTLSVDAGVVERAKAYAARQGTSVSRLVETYLGLISRPPAAREPTPILARLRGSLQAAGGDTRGYRRYLERKYR